MAEFTAEDFEATASAVAGAAHISLASDDREPSSPRTPRGIAILAEALRLAASNMRERERVVKWLRERGVYYDDLGGEYHHDAGFYKKIANAIERGEHMEKADG